jgi:hypothetical protein
VREPSITEQTSTIKEGRQAEAAAEAHSSLRTACTMSTTPTTAQKIAQYSYNPKEKWTKTVTSLHHNPHPEKLTTPRSGHFPTNNIHHLILRSFQKHTQTIAKDILYAITNLVITPQPTTPSHRQFHK